MIDYLCMYFTAKIQTVIASMMQEFAASLYHICKLNICGFGLSIITLEIIMFFLKKYFLTFYRPKW